MHFILKILFFQLAIVGIGNALPAATETGPQPAFGTGHLAPPPGVKVFTAKNPPEAFEIPERNATATPQDGLEKRDDRDRQIRLKYCDNWWYGGQCGIDFIWVENRGWNINAFHPFNMEGRISSFEAYNPSGPWKTCRMHNSYYFSGGESICAGDYLYFSLGAGMYTTNNFDKLQGFWNDAIVCVICYH